GAAVGTVMAGATVGETLSAASISPTVEPESPPALPEIVAPSPPLTRSLEEPVVPVPILSSTNGTQAETIEDVPAPPESAEPAAAPLPDFRQALTELFGDLATDDSPPSAVAETEQPPAPVEAEPAAEPVTAAPPPVESGNAIRIPFERVMGQLPPGAFRLPLHQVGAQLAKRDMLLVPPALIVPQLGE